MIFKGERSNLVSGMMSKAKPLIVERTWATVSNKLTCPESQGAGEPESQRAREPTSKREQASMREESQVEAPPGLHNTCLPLES